MFERHLLQVRTPSPTTSSGSQKALAKTLACCFCEDSAWDVFRDSRLVNEQPSFASKELTEKCVKRILRRNDLQIALHGVAKEHAQQGTLRHCTASGRIISSACGQVTSPPPILGCRNLFRNRRPSKFDSTSTPNTPPCHCPPAH